VLTVGNDGHVTDVGRAVHETTDLASVSSCASMCADIAMCVVLCARYIPPRR
jgi:hypothetical protein